MRISDWSSDVCSSDLAGHFGDPVDTRHVAVGVVEQDTVADPHVVAHGVARLVVAHAGPGLGADALQVVDREIRWFGLHQPVAFAWTHSASKGAGKICRSVQTASIRPSQDWAAIVATCWVAKRSEAARVGHECVTMCRSGWSPYD